MQALAGRCRTVRHRVVVVGERLEADRLVEKVAGLGAVAEGNGYVVDAVVVARPFGELLRLRRLGVLLALLVLGENLDRLGAALAKLGLACRSERKFDSLGALLRELDLGRLEEVVLVAAGSRNGRGETVR